MKQMTIIVLLFSWQIFAKASDLKEDSTRFSVSSIGFGGGLDYGGIGTRATIAYKDFAVLLGAGTVFIGVGFNIGVMYRGVSDKRARPTASVMYGYNAVIIVKNTADYDKIYYGTSMGFGLEIRSKKKQGNYLHLEMILPLRSADFWVDLKKLESNPNINIFFEPFPILVGIGYHLALK